MNLDRNTSAKQPDTRYLFWPLRSYILNISCTNIMEEKDHRHQYDHYHVADVVRIAATKTRHKESMGSKAEAKIRLPSQATEAGSEREAVSTGASVDAEDGGMPLSAHGGSIPDGGAKAWIQILGSFFVLFATWGLVNSFGVYQTYYEGHTQFWPSSSSPSSSSSSSAISWIGSLQGAILMLLGPVSGPLYDAGYFLPLITSGLSLIVIGMLMTSFSSAYWHILLAQGVCVGIGCGLAFLPATAVLAQYFARKRVVAMGMASVGSPIAGMVFPVIFTKIEAAIRGKEEEENKAFQWATRVIAFILLAACILPVACMRTRLPPTPKAQRRGMLDLSAFKDKTFVVFVASCFLLFLGLYVPFFYIQLFGVTRGIAVSSDGADGRRGFDSAYLVTLLNAGSIAGRLVPNYLADRYGALNAFLAVALGAAVCVCAWLSISTIGSVVVFALFYGAFSGGVVSLMPAVVANTLSPDPGRIGVRLGMLCAVSGTAVLVGTPVAGAIVEGHTNKDWDRMIGYAAATLVMGTLLCWFTRFLVWRRDKNRADVWYGSRRRWWIA